MELGRLLPLGRCAPGQFWDLSNQQPGSQRFNPWTDHYDVIDPWQIGDGFDGEETDSDDSVNLSVSQRPGNFIHFRHFR